MAYSDDLIMIVSEPFYFDLYRRFQSEKANPFQLPSSKLGLLDGLKIRIHLRQIKC